MWAGMDCAKIDSLSRKGSSLLCVCKPVLILSTNHKTHSNPSDQSQKKPPPIASLCVVQCKIVLVCVVNVSTRVYGEAALQLWLSPPFVHQSSSIIAQTMKLFGCYAVSWNILLHVRLPRSPLGLFNELKATCNPPELMWGVRSTQYFLKNVE